MKYFAYGSNMSHRQMQDRCRCNSHFIKRVYLENYKFIYDGYSCRWKCAVANVIESTGDTVWGGLFEINNICLDQLDGHEGYRKNIYDRKVLKLKDEDDNIFEAWTYYRTGEKEGEPSREYKNIIIQGAKDCGLPTDYIQNNLSV